MSGGPVLASRRGLAAAGLAAVALASLARAAGARQRTAAGRVETRNPGGVAAPLGAYSHAAIAPPGHRLAMIAGQVGYGPDGNLVGPDDPARQIRQVFANLGAVLAGISASWASVLSLRTFLTRREDIATFRQVRDELYPAYFPDRAFPPNTLVIVSGLADPAMLVEIEAVAVVPER